MLQARHQPMLCLGLLCDYQSWLDNIWLRYHHLTDDYDLSFGFYQENAHTPPSSIGRVLCENSMVKADSRMCTCCSSTHQVDTETAGSNRGSGSSQRHFRWPQKLPLIFKGSCRDWRPQSVATLMLHHSNDGVIHQTLMLHKMVNNSIIAMMESS